MRRGGTEVTAERLQNTTGLRCEGTKPAQARGAKPAREGEGERHCGTWPFAALLFCV